VRDALQHRDAEGECLAGAGPGLADDVVAVQGDRQGERLNGERVYDALGLEGIGYLGYYPEVTESSQGFQPPSCGVLSPPPAQRLALGTPSQRHTCM
jgi:hypothetical protein